MLSITPQWLPPELRKNKNKNKSPAVIYHTVHEWSLPYLIISNVSHLLYFNHVSILITISLFSKHPKVVFPVITLSKYSSNWNVISTNLWLFSLCYSGLSLNVTSPERYRISPSNSATQYCSITWHTLFTLFYNGWYYKKLFIK